MNQVFEIKHDTIHMLVFFLCYWLDIYILVILPRSLFIKFKAFAFIYQLLIHMFVNPQKYHVQILFFIYM